MILYRGPSLIDGGPILCLATRFDRVEETNIKKITAHPRPKACHPRPLVMGRPLGLDDDEEEPHNPIAPTYTPEEKERLREAGMEPGRIDAIRIMRGMLMLASPGDAAEIILDLVGAASDPWALAQRLMPDLAKIKRGHARAM